MDEENINIIELVLDTLNRDDLWFTQKTDPTYQEASSYYELDEFGDPTEKTIKKIEKEVNSLIGDGAIDIIDAVELWKNDQIAEFRLDFRDNLVTKFEPKPVVDNIEAYENSVQLSESKKVESTDILDTPEYNDYLKSELEKRYNEYCRDNGEIDFQEWLDEYSDAEIEDLEDKYLANLDESKKVKTEDYDYDEYVKNQEELKKDYKDRIMKSATPEIINAFNDLNDILNEGGNLKELDGFYFPDDAITIVDLADKNYHLNSAMDLTTSNILNMVGNNDTFEQAIDELFADYDADSAYSWADNFVTVLGKLDFDIHIDESKKTEASEYISKYDELNDLLRLYANFDNDKMGLYNYFNSDAQMNTKFDDDKYNDWLDDMKENHFGELYRYLQELDNDLDAEMGELNESKSFGRALRELKTEAKQDKTELTPEQKANKIANIGSLVGKAKYPFQLNAVIHTLSFVDQDLSNKLRQTFNPATIKQDGIEDARNGIAQMIFDETGVDVLAPNMEFATESKNVNFNNCTKDKKDENYQRRLEEVNNKSANTIKDILQSDGFDSESNAGKIVLRTQDLFTALSDLGLDVDVTFDNGDSTSTIQLGTAGGKVVITINDPEKPLKAFMSGNVELTGDSLEKFQSIEDRIKTV